MASITPYRDGMGKPGELIYAGGEYRKLSAIARRSEPGRGLFAAYGADRDKEPIIDPKDWVEVDWSRFCGLIKDQDGRGGCLPYTAVGGLQYCRHQGGLSRIALNAMALYGSLRYPHDQGSEFEEVLQLISSEGVVPESVLSDDKENWDPKRFPANYKEIAREFRPLEIRDCPTRESIGSAIQRAFYVVAGVSVTNGFEPDSDGIIQPYRVGQLNHAIGFCGYRVIGGNRYYRLVNSWSTAWGDKGYAWFPESCLPKTLNCWAVRSCTTPVDDRLWK